MRSAISPDEMVAGFIKGKVAEASIAPDRCPRADGDVAERTDLRSPFAMANWRQRHGPLVILCHHFRFGRLAPGRADRGVGLERYQERKAGMEDRIVPHDAQSHRRVVVCDYLRPA